MKYSKNQLGPHLDFEKKVYSTFIYMGISKGKLFLFYFITKIKELDVEGQGYLTVDDLEGLFRTRADQKLFWTA